MRGQLFLIKTKEKDPAILPEELARVTGGEVEEVIMGNLEGDK